MTGSMFDFAPTDAELEGKIRELHRSQLRMETELRASMRWMSSLTCTCAPWFDWDNREPPQVGCPIHGVLVMGIDGKVL